MLRQMQRRQSSFPGRNMKLVLLAVTMVGFLHRCAAEPARGYFHHLDASHCRASMSVNVLIRPENVKLTLLLKESSRDFIPEDSLAHGSFFDLRRRACFYQGGNPDDPDDSSAVAKQVLDQFSATFSHSGSTYEITNQPADSPEFEARRLPPAPFKFSCGLDRTHGHNEEANRHARLRRSITGGGKIDQHSPVYEAQQTYISLVLVGDRPFVDGTGGNFTKAIERLWEIGNYINNLYKPLGVNVVTVRADALFGDDLSLGNETFTNSSIMLDNFLKYRMQYLTDVQHTAAHLVSGLKMIGANVGLAKWGKLCQFSLAAGVNTDVTMNGSAFNVAVTVAHELGHNLGMEHDPDTQFSCGCRDPQGCIMTAVGTEVNPIHFSNCSIQKYKELAVSNGLAYCMTRPPSKAVLGTIAPKCGNRILEEGEECDCGTPDYCTNTCCNPSTCKFKPGATCASGQCCNTTSCSVMPRGSVCRTSKGVCDLPEYCNGISEWCPLIDDYKIDGTACAKDPTNASKVLAYCYQATCVTRDSRCKALFAASDFRAAPESFSAKTSDSFSVSIGEGYCGYKPETYSPLKYKFEACAVQNQRCGTLYCVGTMPDGFPEPNWKGMDINDAKSITPVGSEQTVAYARLDTRLSGYRDPGLVPDGAECGTGMMCVNSECVNVSAVKTNATVLSEVSRLPNCSGNGDVTRTGLCFCHYGFRPPDCITVGYGGSLTNLPTESGDITTSTATTPKPTTPTTRLEFTTLEQKRDDFWMFVGIGIAIGIVVILGILFFVWLYFWCRRNDTTPYIGGFDAAVTDPNTAVKFRNSCDMRSYPLVEPASLDQVVMSALEFNNGTGNKAQVERHYNGSKAYDNDAYNGNGRSTRPVDSSASSKYEVELGVPGTFVKKA